MKIIQTLHSEIDNEGFEADTAGGRTRKRKHDDEALCQGTR